MSKLIERLKKYLESDDSKKFFDKLTFIDNLEKHYTDLFHSFSFEKKCEIIDKIISKYESDKYNIKEYNHGRQPQYMLYGMLYSYCLSYADKEYHDENIPFENTCFVFCLNYKLEVIYGQGTLIRVHKFRNIDNETVQSYNDIINRIGKDTFCSEFISDYDSKEKLDVAEYIVKNYK